MKLDYGFLKQILATMEANESHEYYSVELAKSLGLDLEEDKSFDKFFGHIKFLNDGSCIDCPNPNLGIQKVLSGKKFYFNIEYRLTPQGYEFLNMLNNQKIFNKIKNLAIPTAIEVGKSMLIRILGGEG